MAHASRSAGASPADVQATLARALDDKQIPDGSRIAAQKLLDRLVAPVRVTLMGWPGIGKSRVLNLLAGSQIVPEDLGLPTLQLLHGREALARLTMADGTAIALGSADLRELAKQRSVYAEVELDLPALRKISLLEVAAGPAPSDQIRAMQWSAPRSDILIWCTRRFGREEQDVWQAIPEVLRDHAILLRTHADEVGDVDAREDALFALRRIVGEDVPHVLAIDTPEALASRAPDGQIDKARLKASGAQKLIGAILRMVEGGRQHGVDQAEILLRRIGVEIGSDAVAVPSRTEVSREPDARNATPAVKEQRSAGGETVSNVVPAAARIATEPPVGSSRRTSVRRNTLQIREALEAGIERLSRTGVELIRSAELTPSTVMARSVREIQWLSDHLEGTAGDDAALRAARDLAMEAMDLIQLMRLEKSDSAALEAVSLMIQLRRSLGHSLSQELALAA